MTDWYRAVALSNRIAGDPRLSKLHAEMKRKHAEIAESFNAAVEREIINAGGPELLGGLVTALRVGNDPRQTDIMAGETCVARVKLDMRLGSEVIRIVVERYPNEGKER